VDTLTNLRTFLAVVQADGFSKAARQLDVVPSVVAKRIAQLEHSLGTRLFERTTRAVVLTEAGHRLRVRAADTVEGFDALARAVANDDGKLEGHIRLMAPTTLTTLFLGGALVDFLAQHPRITLDVALADRSVNPLEQAFDIVISGRTAHYDGVTQRPLAPIDYVLCAAPAYLAQRTTPIHPSDLATHDCLVFRPTGPSWAFRSARGLVLVDVTARLVADDNRTLLLAAERGLGISLLPGYIARPALGAGRLRGLLADFAPQEAWFKAYVPKRLDGTARIEALCTAIGQAMAALQSPDQAPESTAY
jgi:DNA-binding transcriptional LysR family regulator